MKNDLVSVVVTFYNKEKYMESCIDSIVNQTYKDLEIILVDDCSTDRTLEICRGYEAKDRRIKVIAKENNEGLSAARYTGLEAVKGEWLMLVDGDDLISHGIIERFVQISQMDQSIDIVSGARIFSKVPENEVNKCGGKGFVILDEGRVFANKIYRDKTIDTTLVCKLFRMELIRKLNLLQYKNRCPQMFFEDYLLTPIIFNEARNVAILESAYWVHREDENSVSRSRSLSKWSFDHIEAGRIVVDYCMENSLDGAWERELSKYIAHLTRIYCLMDLQEMDEEEKKGYSSIIWKYYNHYIKQYVRHTEDDLLRRTAMTGFKKSKKIWKKLILKTYYRNYNRKER